MKTTKLIMIMLLMMGGISGCNTVQIKMMCDQIKAMEIEPIIAYDISFKFERCRVRCFNFNTWKSLPAKSCPTMPAGPVIIVVDSSTQERSEAVNMPLNYCEGMRGFNRNDMITKIRPNIKRLNNIKVNFCD